MSHNNKQQKPPSTILLGLLLVLLLVYPLMAIAAAALDSSNCGGVYTYATGTGKRATGAGFGPRKSVKLPNGKYSSSYHEGVDIPLGSATDKNAYSTIDGKVEDIVLGYNGGHGNQIVIISGGVKFTYSHVPDGMIKVKEGQKVEAGQVIADYNGKSTGNTTGAHIHYEAQVQDALGEWVNVDPAVIEEMLTGAHGGICPSAAYFGQYAINTTMIRHKIADIHNPAGVVDPNSINQNICSKKAGVVTPPVAVTPGP